MTTQELIKGAPPIKRTGHILNRKPVRGDTIITYLGYKAIVTEPARAINFYIADGKRVAHGDVEVNGNKQAIEWFV